MCISLFEKIERETEREYIYFEFYRIRFIWIFRNGKQIKLEILFNSKFKPSFEFCVNLDKTFLKSTQIKYKSNSNQNHNWII
jgi:hypothetical protein